MFVWGMGCTDLDNALQGLPQKLVACTADMSQKHHLAWDGTSWSKAGPMQDPPAGTAEMGQHLCDLNVVTLDIAMVLEGNCRTGRPAELAFRFCLAHVGI